MTQEELEKSMYLDLIKAFENNLMPSTKNEDKFVKAHNNGELEPAFEELEGLRIKMNQGKDVSGFTKKVFEKLNNIRNIISGDPVFIRANGNEEFTNSLKELQNRFKFAEEYLTNEKLLATSEEVLIDWENKVKEAQKEELAIKADKTLSDFDRTIKLVVAKNLIGEEKSRRDKVLKSRDESKAKLEESLKKMEENLNIDELLNGVFESINKIDSLYKSIVLSEQGLDKLGEAIRDLRDEVIIYRRDITSDKVRYNEILEKVGLMPVNTSKEIVSQKITELKEKIALLNKDVVEKSNEVKPVLPSGFEKKIDELDKKEEKKEDLASEVNNTPNKDNLSSYMEEFNKYFGGIDKPKEKEKITELSDLIKELKKLNKDIEIVQGKDGAYVLTDDLANIILPDGFKYTKGLGINNKKNDFTPYINIPTEERKKVLSPEPNIINPAPKSHIPSGRLKVKKTRRAIIDSYIKATLCYGSLGTVIALGVGAIGAPVIGGAALITSIGVIGQTIYNKLIKSGKIVTPDSYAVKSGNPDWIPLVGSDIISDAKSLLNCIRNKRKKKKEEVLDNQEENLNTEDKKSTLIENFKNKFNSYLKQDDLANKPLSNLQGEEYSLNGEVNLNRGGGR